MSVSLPLPPTRLSLPLPPVITSAFAEPVRVTAVPFPLLVSVQPEAPVAELTLILKPLAVTDAVPALLLEAVAVQAAVAVECAVAPAEMTRISEPFPRSMMKSVPESTLNVSFPVPPVSKSLPPPPVMVSAPEPPVIVSALVEPTSVTAVALPLLVMVQPEVPVTALILTFWPAAVMFTMPLLLLADVAVQPETAVALAVAPAATIKTSAPFPKSVIESVPLSTLNVSAPAPPVSVSLPPEPRSTLLPALPVRVSLKDEPVRFSNCCRVSVPDPPVFCAVVVDRLTLTAEPVEILRLSMP